MGIIKSKMKKVSAQPEADKPSSLSVAYGVMRNSKPKKMADGGMVAIKKENYSEMPHSGSIAEAIMRKRKMADGGMVDLDANEMEGRNEADIRNEEALDETLYDAMDVEQPLDSNEHSMDIDSDEHDMISRIRAKLRAKRGI